MKTLLEEDVKGRWSMKTFRDADHPPNRDPALLPFTPPSLHRDHPPYRHPERCFLARRTCICSYRPETKCRSFGPTKTVGPQDDSEGRWSMKTLLEEDVKGRWSMKTFRDADHPPNRDPALPPFTPPSLHRDHPPYRHPERRSSARRTCICFFR